MKTAIPSTGYDCHKEQEVGSWLNDRSQRQADHQCQGSPKQRYTTGQQSSALIIAISPIPEQCAPTSYLPALNHQPKE
jgi:hypothetical protein